MKPADKIKELINKSNVQTDSQTNKRILSDALEHLERLKQKKLAGTRSNVWRTIMKSRLTKLAVAAVIIIAVMVGIHQFSGSIDGASVAWAGLAERVEQIKTCIFRGQVTMTGGPKGKTAPKTEMEIYVSSEYGFRSDTYIDGKLGMIQYALPADKALISVMPEQKKYLRMLLTDEHLRKMRQQGNDPREMVRQFMSAEYTELGRDVIDGIEVEGIETTDPKVHGGQFESYVGRLWVDVETDLPVRMEMEMQMDVGKDGPMQALMVMDGFEWDVELEPGIFEPNIPADYTLIAEVKLPGQDEGSAVQGLRVFAEITGGQYPSSMYVMKVIKEVADVVKQSFDKEGIEGDPNSKPSQEERDNMMKKVMEKTASVQGACMFYAELVKQGKEPAYYGESVGPDDTDAVLMRWKISDDEYRVIFGDLTTENVTAEQLAELEKATLE